MMTFANTLAAAPFAADFCTPVCGHDRAWTTERTIGDRVDVTRTRVDVPSTGQLRPDASGVTTSAWSPPT